MKITKSSCPKDEEIAEWKRLFYVAYTRAQFLMILPLYEKYGQEFLGKTLVNYVNQYNNEIRFIYDK